LRYQVEIERRSQTGFNYLVGTGYAGKHYNPGIGFEAWKNYQLYVTRFEYSWFAKESSPLYKTYINIWPYTYINNSYNNYDILNLNSTISTSTKSGYRYQLIGFYSFENIRDTATFLGLVEIPEGHYNYSYAEVTFKTPDSYPLKSTIKLNFGQFYDGTRFSFTVKPTWNPSRYFEFESLYQFDKIEIPDRNQKGISHLFRFKTLFMLNTKLSLAAFIQYSNVDGLTISNLRFRFNPKEGNDLYIVYNHGINTNRTDLSPVPPLSNNWNINIKYVYTFIL
jgi:hypothetical protein